MPRVLIDSAVLDGSAAALPPAWLEGLHLVPFAARDPASLVRGLRDADAVLLRSVTPLPAALLAGARRLQAVATLSAGTDHLDVAALEARGIALHTGHGGNAGSVADWVEWALGRLWSHGSVVNPWSGKRILVIGVGRVGSVVAARAAHRGAEVVPCDPPRAAREPGFRSVDLGAALRAGGLDAVTLHVPLERSGDHATAGLVEARVLQGFSGAVVLNAARGGVLDEAAAVAAREAGRLVGLAIDTFRGEPQPDPRVVAACDLATPHVAGHSIEGKLRVAQLAILGLRAQFGLPGALDLDAAVLDHAAESGAPDALDPCAALDRIDAAFRLGPPGPAGFEGLRHGHRRRETPSPARP